MNLDVLANIRLDAKKFIKERQLARDLPIYEEDIRAAILRRLAFQTNLPDLCLALVEIVEHAEPPSNENKMTLYWDACNKLQDHMKHNMPD